MAGVDIPCTIPEPVLARDLMASLRASDADTARALALQLAQAAWRRQDSALANAAMLLAAQLARPGVPYLAELRRVVECLS